MNDNTGMLLLPMLPVLLLPMLHQSLYLKKILYDFTLSILGGEAKVDCALNVLKLFCDIDSK